MIKALAVTFALLLVSTTADAGPRHRASFDLGELLPHPAGCPRIAFCGCGVSVKLWGQAKREYFRAAAYFRFPKAHAARGMVAVRNHHVMYIEDVDANGNATVYDPNGGGHRTWRRVRSLAGYSIRNPNG